MESRRSIGPFFLSLAVTLGLATLVLAIFPQADARRGGYVEMLKNMAQSRDPFLEEFYGHRRIHDGKRSTRRMRPGELLTLWLNKDGKRRTHRVLMDPMLDPVKRSSPRGAFSEVTAGSRNSEGDNEVDSGRFYRR